MVPNLVFSLGGRTRGGTSRGQRHGNRRFRVNASFNYRFPSKCVVMAHGGHHACGQGRTIRVRRGTVFALLVFYFPTTGRECRDCPASFFSGRLTIGGSDTTGRTDRVAGADVVVRGTVTML